MFVYVLKSIFFSLQFCNYCMYFASVPYSVHPFCIVNATHFDCSKQQHIYVDCDWILKSKAISDVVYALINTLMALSRSTKARWERIILIGRGLCNNVFYKEMTHCKFISLVGLHSLIVKLYIVYPDPSIHLQGIMFIKSLLYLQICQIVFSLSRPNLSFHLSRCT